MGYGIMVWRGDNGYRLTWSEDVDEDTTIHHEEYIEDDESDEIKSGESLLWFVMDHFGFGGSKHDPERLRVVREKRE